MKKQRSREHNGGCTYKIRIGITLNLVQNENDNSSKTHGPLTNGQFPASVRCARRGSW